MLSIKTLSHNGGLKIKQLINTCKINKQTKKNRGVFSSLSFLLRESVSAPESDAEQGYCSAAQPLR